MVMGNVFIQKYESSAERENKNFSSNNGCHL